MRKFKNKKTGAVYVALNVPNTMIERKSKIKTK